MQPLPIQRHSFASLIAIVACASVNAFSAVICAENPKTQEGEPVEGECVWFDPSIRSAADGPRRVNVWFDRQFLGDGDPYERRIREFGGIGRRELRSRTVTLRQGLSENSFAGAKDALDGLAARGEIHDTKRHWIVNGFGCTTTPAG